MANSGSKSITVTSQNTLKFSWWENSQSIANNTTTIGWKMELIAGSSGYISSSATKDWAVTVNGTKYSGTNTVGISNNSTKTLASGTTTIVHNSDGTKTFSYSFSQELAIYWGSAYIGTKSGSGSGTLDTIPRKSTLSASNGTLGTTQTLTVTRQSSNFTHTITYTCGSVSETICTKSTSTSISWKPSLNLANQNTTGTSVSVVFTITTYNGDVLLGSNTKTITCTVPSSVVPTVSLTVQDAMGYLAGFGAYIQNKSKYKIVATASGNYGSTIKSVEIAADGKKYTGTEVTTDVITETGTQAISVTVTDSRGRTATTSTSVMVLAYSSPVISSLNIRRCNSDGSSNSAGEYLAVVFSGTVTSLNSKNTATYKVQYKKVKESSYTTAIVENYEGQYSVSNGIFVFAADTASSYNITLIATDAFTSVSKNAAGSSISVFWSWVKGVGIALGKVIEKTGVEVDMDTWFYKNMYLKVGERDFNILDIMHPVGSIYMSVSNTNPSTFFGGTWVTWGSGKVPVGVNADEIEFSTVEKTGGEKTHKLVVGEMPSHTHDTFNYNESGGTKITNGYGIHFAAPPPFVTYTARMNMSNTGGGQAHNNLQPYITCYMWKRVA